MSLNIGEWIDLGVHYEACMTDPQTCGAAGGAISIWLRLQSVHVGGLLTTRTRSTIGTKSTGITIIKTVTGIM